MRTPATDDKLNVEPTERAGEAVAPCAKKKGWLRSCVSDSSTGLLRHETCTSKLPAGCVSFAEPRMSTATTCTSRHNIILHVHNNSREAAARTRDALDCRVRGGGQSVRTEMNDHRHDHHRPGNKRLHPERTHTARTRLPTALPLHVDATRLQQ